MSGEKGGLSDDEYAALLRDLEGRADSGSASGEQVPDEVEDIEAFLRDLEGEADDSSKTVTKTATRSAEEDALAAEFAALEAKGELIPLPEDEPEEKAKKKEKKSRKKERSGKARKSRAERREEKAAAREQKREEKAAAQAERAQGRSRGKRAGLFVLKNGLWFSPALILWWVLGAYLGQWISAGWLIGAVSTMFVFGLPGVLRRVVKRGGYRPWSLGFSLLAVVLLIAPMPNIAAQNLARYGHWPASALGEALGSAPDAAYIRAQGSASAWLASKIGTSPGGLKPRQLGTMFGLDVERPKEPVVPLEEEPVLEPEDGPPIDMTREESAPSGSAEEPAAVDEAE